MYKTEYVIKDEMHKILWYFQIQMAYLIPIRRPDLILINKKKKKKKTCQKELAASADSKVKIKESRKSDRYLYGVI